MLEILNNCEGMLLEVRYYSNISSKKKLQFVCPLISLRYESRQNTMPGGFIEEEDFDIWYPDDEFFINHYDFTILIDGSLRMASFSAHEATSILREFIDETGKSFETHEEEIEYVLKSGFVFKEEDFDIFDLVEPDEHIWYTNKITEFELRIAKKKNRE